MKNAENISVGSIVSIPIRCFAPNRRGWNGWLFTLGIVEKIYKGPKSGKMCATVKYCSRRGGRYELLPVTYATINVYLDNCFDPTLDISCAKQNMPEFEEVEKNGEQVCWSNEIAFLVDQGIIKYWKNNKEETV